MTISRLTIAALTQWCAAQWRATAEWLGALLVFLVLATNEILFQVWRQERDRRTNERAPAADDEAT